jgi:hypothetical protein
MKRMLYIILALMLAFGGAAGSMLVHPHPAAAATTLTMTTDSDIDEGYYTSDNLTADTQDGRPGFIDPNKEDDTILTIDTYSKAIGPNINTIIENHLQAWTKLADAKQFTFIDRNVVVVANIYQYHHQL